MHQDLQTVVDGLGIELPHISAAADRSTEVIKEAGNHLRGLVPPNGLPLDVVVLGSIARLESGPDSDFDFLLVAHGLPPNPMSSRELFAAVEQVQEKLGLRDPGATRMFGVVVSAPDLTERIGLEDDTNRTHSHRVLVLEESCSIYQPNLHHELLTKIVERYLHDYGDPDHPVARFLLNDVLRFWRTLAVDYQAKRWERLGREWGLRFLKLVISRKLTLAGTLAAIFRCDKPTVEKLVFELEKPPLARLAAAYPDLESRHQKEIGEVLQIADKFIGLLADSQFRTEAKDIAERSDIREDSEFGRAREDGRELQGLLEAIFFDSKVFGAKSRRYLSF